ncbi:hypothetical protein BgiBS90_003736, partial [Biomphalaria glabrata]
AQQTPLTPLRHQVPVVTSGRCFGDGIALKVRGSSPPRSSSKFQQIFFIFYSVTFVPKPTDVIKRHVYSSLKDRLQFIL